MPATRHCLSLPPHVLPRTDTRVHLLLERAQEGLVLVQLSQADGAGRCAGLHTQALRLDGSNVHLHRQIAGEGFIEQGEPALGGSPDHLAWATLPQSRLHTPSLRHHRPMRRTTSWKPATHTPALTSPYSVRPRPRRSTTYLPVPVCDRMHSAGWASQSQAWGRAGEEGG